LCTKICTCGSGIEFCMGETSPETQGLCLRGGGERERERERERYRDKEIKPETHTNGSVTLLVRASQIKRTQPYTRVSLQ